MSKKRKMKNYISGLLTVICCLFYCGQDLVAQNGRTGVLVSQADSLRSEYLFSESVEACREALASEADTAARMKIEDKLLLGENGISMSSFVSTPSVVARHKFSIDEFYLFYPLQDRSWRPAPNLLDTLGTHPFSKAAYVPEGSREIYFSAPDQEGAMNIYRTELKDTVWSLPALINEDMTSPWPLADETFDIIVHPVANCYIQDVRFVFRECARVLKKGGILVCGLDNEINCVFNDDQTKICYKLPFNPLEDPKAYEDSIKYDWGIQFSHPIEDQIGGQLRAGFCLTDIFEDTNGYGLLHEYNVPTFYATRAIKKGE